MGVLRGRAVMRALDCCEVRRTGIGQGISLSADGGVPYGTGDDGRRAAKAAGAVSLFRFADGRFADDLDLSTGGFPDIDQRFAIGRSVTFFLFRAFGGSRRRLLA